MPYLLIVLYLFACLFINRNAVLEANLSEKGYSAPNARKTGTTIAGLIFKVCFDTAKHDLCC